MNISQKGLAGEYYVLAQLTARGINASLTLGNTKGVDILVYNEEKKRGYCGFFISYLATYWQQTLSVLFASFYKNLK